MASIAQPGVPANLTNFTLFLKERHVFANLVDQFVSKHPILKRFQSRPMVQIDGRTARWNVSTRDAVSFGAVPEHEQPPPADAPAADEGTIAIATLMATVQISYHLLKMSKRQVASFVMGQTKLMTSTVAGFMQNLQRVLIAGWGDGCLAQIKTITLNTPTSGTHRLELEPEMDAERLTGTRYMLRGLRLSVSATRVGTALERNADLQVVDRNASLNYVYVKGDMGTTANADFLFWWQSKNKMPLGILAGADDGTQGPTTTYHGVARTSLGHTWAQGRVRSNLGGGDIEDAIQQMVDDIDVEGGGEPDIAYLSLETWRRFARDLRAGRQYIAQGDPRYVAGVSTIAFTGAGSKDLAINRDRDIPAGVMLLLDMSTWHLGEVQAPDWIQIDGEPSPWHRIGRQADWEANFGWIGNLICDKPNSNGVIYDVA